jgi:ABC-type Mn2+/Zn2+ transport system permease subunit
MMLYYNTVIVLSGVSLLGALAGLVGAFAVLRKRSLTGDALAHAALPGVCLGYLVVGERFLPALLLGALLSGVLGIVTINLLTTPSAASLVPFSVLELRSANGFNGFRATAARRGSIRSCSAKPPV